MKLEHKQKQIFKAPSEYCKTLKEVSVFLNISYSEVLVLKKKVLLNYNFNLWNIIFKKGYSKELFLEEMKKDIKFNKKFNDFINCKIGN
tara:strand:+ start:1665 stop:1931 length:267 start_codon:yes stop_codon:yes gene_type:complete